MDEHKKRLSGWLRNKTVWASAGSVIVGFIVGYTVCHMSQASLPYTVFAALAGVGGIGAVVCRGFGVIHKPINTHFNTWGTAAFVVTVVMMTCGIIAAVDKYSKEQETRIGQIAAAQTHTNSILEAVTRSATAIRASECQLTVSIGITGLGQGVPSELEDLSISCLIRGAESDLQSALTFHRFSIVETKKYPGSRASTARTVILLHSTHCEFDNAAEYNYLDQLYGSTASITFPDVLIAGEHDNSGARRYVVEQSVELRVGGKRWKKVLRARGAPFEAERELAVTLVDASNPWEVEELVRKD